MHRLLGLETEYAIRFSPAPDAKHPTNLRIYDAIAASVGRRVATRPGAHEREVFVENGGALHYEAVPWAEADGLVEGATPECRSAAAAVLYQRAQDALLCQALPGAREELAREGFFGELGLLKNCRDADGHTYGAQENYEVEVARGLGLVAWRAGLALLVPAVIAASLATWIVVLVLLPLLLGGMIVFGLVALAVPLLRQTALFQALFNGVPAPHLARGMMLAAHALERVLWAPAMAPFLLLCRAVAFRRVRRALVPYLVSRIAVTGAGTVVGGAFRLSEKATATDHVIRTHMRSASRAMFDVGNLCTQVAAPATLDLRGFARLWRRRQRLQLGLSDSNMAERAEYLKVAVTCLVIDAAEAGALDDVAPLRQPLDALRAINDDPSLRARVRDRGGRERTALEIQRDYADRLRRFVQSRPATSLDAAETVRHFVEVLDALERDPQQLVGWLDWVTKQRLLAGDALSPEARKKIDLKYHELGAGYFAGLAARGLSPRLFDDARIADAMRAPPEGTPAQARAAVMREHSVVRVTWDHVRLGGRLGGRVGGRVIRLDDHRDKR